VMCRDTALAMRLKELAVMGNDWLANNDAIHKSWAWLYELAGEEFEIKRAKYSDQQLSQPCQSASAMRGGVSISGISKIMGIKETGISRIKGTRNLIPEELSTCPFNSPFNSVDFQGFGFRIISITRDKGTRTLKELAKVS